ncbi:hypothetical protein [Nitrobacter sp. JJSN]|uniref:hypothetical protein n=1 Tax=Nitrobacter sp. JJSN TaxID=3453033 RepID=UPI003F76E18C
MPPPRDPSHGQTAEEIERYYRNAKSGDLAAVRSSQYGRLEIKITTVSNINPEAGSIHLNDDAVWGGVAYFCGERKELLRVQRPVIAYRSKCKRYGLG